MERRERACRPGRASSILTGGARKPAPRRQPCPDQDPPPPALLPTPLPYDTDTEAPLSLTFPQGRLRCLELIRL